MELPAALHALFLEAIETYSALSDASPFQARDAAHALLDHAMVTAGFPVHDARRPERTTSSGQRSSAASAAGNARFKASSSFASFSTPQSASQVSLPGGPCSA
jgi:hypothetical protein